jgi:catechol 2,3-dioxygenase-like lactoylglutathione lyase family enzyme
MVGSILSHVTLGVRDLARAAAFYDAVLGELGIARGKSGEGFAGWGSGHEGGFFAMLPLNGQPASVGNGVSLSFLAPSREAVDRFHAGAIALGASDEGRPGLRPNYHADYYAA